MQSDINYALFGAKRVQSAVEDLRAQPKLTRAQFVELKHKRDILMARFDEVTKIMQPLEESYIRARRKLGPNYDPTRDKALQDVNKAAGERYEQLLGEIEPLHETWKKVVAAREAWTYLEEVLRECRKLCTTIKQSVDLE
jgi:hypothetical protein